MGAVDHHRAEAVVDAALAGLEIRAVIEVQHDRNTLAVGRDFLGVLDRALRHVAQQGLVRILAGALGNLKDHRGLGFDAGLENRLHLFHVVEVVRGDRVAALDRLGEQFLGVHKTEIFVAGSH